MPEEPENEQSEEQPPPGPEGGQEPAPASKGMFSAVGEAIGAQQDAPTPRIEDESGDLPTEFKTLDDFKSNWGKTQAEYRRLRGEMKREMETRDAEIARLRGENPGAGVPEKAEDYLAEDVWKPAEILKEFPDLDPESIGENSPFMRLMAGVAKNNGIPKSNFAGTAREFIKVLTGPEGPLGNLRQTPEQQQATLDEKLAILGDVQAFRPTHEFATRVLPHMPEDARVWWEDALDSPYGLIGLKAFLETADIVDKRSINLGDGPDTAGLPAYSDLKRALREEAWADPQDEKFDRARYDQVSRQMEAHIARGTAVD